MIDLVDRGLLRVLASAPLLDRLEWAALSGRPRSTLFRRVAKLEQAGLLDSLMHSSALIPATRRYCLTAHGVRRLALADDCSLDELLRREPVSEQWRRLLLERLDAAASLYRLAAAAAESVDQLRFRWLRASPLDATLLLPDERRVALVRLGSTAERTAFAKRIRRLRETPGLGAVLLLAPDEVRLRQARRLVAGAPAITFLALEREAVVSGAEARVWRGPSGSARLSLSDALTYVVPHRGWTAERPLVRLSLPHDLERQSRTRAWLLPARLTAAEKRALDAIGDWPWIRPAHLQQLLGVGARRLEQQLQRPAELGLVTGLMHSGRRRLSLTEAGLALIARRDRTAVGAARKRWRPTLRTAVTLDAEDAVRSSGEPAWREVSGLRSRQLLRNLAHTESVHWWSARLAQQARTESLTLVQLDPPHRASRYFRHRERMRSIHPDAFGVLRVRSEDWPFLLEWERRAVRPATMHGRLAPYLRYFDTRRPIDDHGAYPTVLVVFEDELTADHFLRVAGEAMVEAQVSVPLLVSDRTALERSGPLGSAWRSVAYRTPAPPF